MKIYVDKDALQEYTTKLTAKNREIFAPISAVGSPLVASTADEMTDTEKVYVYVGTEEGYTTGDWYYYDGSDWVSGGTYNSEGFVLDATLTSSSEPAQAKAAGDKIRQLYADSPNLFDPTVSTPFNAKANVTTTDTSITVEGNYASDYINAAAIIKLKENTTYNFCMKKHVFYGVGRVSYSESQNEGSSYPAQLTTIFDGTESDDVWLKTTFTTTTGYVRLRFFVSWSTSADGKATFDDIMISEGEAPAAFVRHIYAADDMAQVRLDEDDEKLNLFMPLNGGSIEYSHTYTAERQTDKTNIKVYKGFTYYIYTTTDIGTTKINVYVGGDSANLVRLEANRFSRFDPAIDGYLWLFNGSSGYTGQVDFVILPVKNNLLVQWPSMMTSAANLEFITGGTKALADLPLNSVVCFGSTSATSGITDAPFSGAMTCLTFYNLSNGNAQLCIGRYKSALRWKAGGSWYGWQIIKNEDEVYYVGGESGNDSFTAMLLSLAGNNNPKTIYVYEGEYDMFAEYMDEVSAGNIEIPPDDVEAGTYFPPYNAFVPNNTKIIGLGNVTLKMMPEADEITYGASLTWAPLNIYGNVEIENVTVLAHNVRYCLHNDDHNNYQDSVQIYRNCRFIYTHSDINSEDQQLGRNSTIGYGLAKGSKHIYEGCEIVNDSEGNYSALYGHDFNAGHNGSLILKNCIIRSTNFSCTRTVRLQTLATTQGRVRTLFENCYINGGVQYHMHETNSPQNYDVTFINCNKVPLSRAIASGGTIVDPYITRWVNPLPAPTAANPLIDTDIYSGS